MSKTPTKTPPKSATARPAKRTGTGAAVARPRVRRLKGRPKQDSQKVGAEALILATCELLRKKRPREVTIAAVARHAGVNPALIRYYFGDRSSLMLAVARHLFKETAPMREPINTPESAERAVRRMVRQLIDLHREYPAFRELFFDDIMNMPSAAARKLLSQAVGDGVARAQAILSLLRGGAATRGVEPQLEGALLHMALIGMGEIYVSAFKMIEIGTGRKPDRDKVDDQFVDFVADMILRGLRNAEPSSHR